MVSGSDPAAAGPLGPGDCADVGEGVWIRLICPDHPTD